MFYKNLLERLISVTKEIIGGHLTGIYLHGSMAMGCFHPLKSDIDLMIIIEQDISDHQKMEFMKQVVRLNEQAPEKGLELSIVLRKYCNPFLYPTPYELHFSPVHLEWFQKAPQDYVKHMNGEDKDLAAHFTMIRQYGITLYGEEIKNVFAPVPKKDYIDSICLDIENAQEDILVQPVYVILNLCRVLAFLTEGLYLSKKEGGIWGMEHLSSDYHAVIADALECYASGKCMIIQSDAAWAFVREMQKRIAQRLSEGEQPNFRLNNLEN